MGLSDDRAVKLPELVREQLLSGELEGKNRYCGTSEFGDSYLPAETRTRLCVPLSKSLKVNSQIRADAVRFESASIYNYDYYRLGARLGLDRLSEDLYLADFQLSAETRRGLDSSELCYMKIGGVLSYFGLYGSSDLDLQAHFENKDYQRPDGKDDHYRLEAAADHRLRFGRRWFSRQEIDFELTRFDPNDAVNVSSSRLGIAFLTGQESTYLSLAGGPQAGFIIDGIVHAIGSLVAEVCESLHMRGVDFSQSAASATGV